MAVSPTIYHGTEFLEESFWYPSDETSPSVQSRRLQTPQPGAETTIPQTGCSIDKICPLIENCEKAKVVAAMALNLLVFDGKLHHSRSNWACPFHCKKNFSDAHALMRHVLECPHFSSDKVYCSCCNEYDCFVDRTRNESFCGGEDRTTPCHDKGSQMKAKTMRKLTNITGFFTRSRPASRCSSRGLEHPVSPASTTARRQSVFSVTNPTPKPSSAPRTPPVVASTEPSSPPVDPCHEMDAVSSVVCEVPGTGVIRVTRAELPASECRTGTGMTGRRSDSGFSELSGLSTDCTTAPMFADAGDMTESPTEDLSMDARIPSRDVLQEAGAAFSRQVPREMSISHFTFPTASDHPPVSQYRSEQCRESSWTFVRQPLQPGAQLSSRGAQYGLYATDGITTSDHASFAMLNQNSGFQPVVSSSSWEPMTSPYRQGSGDSGFSSGSFTMVDSSPQPGHGPQSRSCGEVPSILAVATPSDFCSPPAEMNGIHCPYCNYRPKGKWTGRKANLIKHIKNQHESDKIPCPGCGKWFSRRDNLATHQTNTCKRRLFGVEFQSARRYAGLETGDGWIDRGNLHTAKRVRQVIH